MTYSIQDIADELYRELDIPSTVGVFTLTSWLRNNIGELNARIGTSFVVNVDATVSPGLIEEEKVIFKKIYEIYRYGQLIRQGMGAAAFDSVLEVKDDGGTVKMVNRNEIAKTFKMLKEQEEGNLEILIRNYKYMKLGSPVAVNGYDGAVGGLTSGVYPNFRFYPYPQTNRGW